MVVSQIIAAEHLTKRFGDLTAVDDVSMAVEKGELYGLLGPNAAGKTTLVRMLCGLASPTSGSARVLGEDVPCREAKTRMGYMPQEPAIYLEMTVHENLLLFARLYSLSRQRARESEDQLLEFIQLKDRRDELAGNLSGGMRHRLSLACAMIHRPELLFLDEPTVGVDPELRAYFWEFFSSLRKDGVTILLTTHYMDEARHCTRIGLMRRGKLIRQGTPASVMSGVGAVSLEDAFLRITRGTEGPP